ncbi:MAG: hypothetical protein EXR05_01805 [Acetobacteraceae bacterium]|nr:hypothetical protein [Acetobacteraceae bacterium]
MTILEEAGVPCTPVLTRARMIEHPKVQASRTVVENAHKQAGRLRQARNAARFSVTAPEHRLRAPSLGKYVQETLCEAKFSADAIASLRGAALGGA